MKESSEEKKRKSRSDTTDGHPRAGGTDSAAAAEGEQGARASETAGLDRGSEAGEAGAATVTEGADAREGGVEEAVPGGTPLPEQDALAAERDRLLREKLELEDKVLRLRADFENFRKRANREKANLIQYGNEALLRDLLPLIDNLERALSLGNPEGALGLFREGIEMVLAEIHKTLAKYGVGVMETLGKEFDPNLHEAMQRVETDQVAPQTVVEEFQKGYEFRESLLRPAKVAVAVAPSRKELTGGEEPAGSGGPREENGAEKADQAEKIIN